MNYYFDYRFAIADKNDRRDLNKLFHELTDKNQSLKKSVIIFKTETIIPPYYEEFLIKINKEKYSVKNEELIKYSDSTSAVYGYVVNNNNNFSYFLIHRQIKPSIEEPVDSASSKREFLFIINSFRSK